MDALATYQIRNFFKQFSPITQEDCNRAAATISSGATITPTSTQGSQSYTVRASAHANGFIIQFRDPNYALDVDLLTVARETYGQLVPIYQQCDGFLEPLRVYTINDVSGDALFLRNSHLHRPENFHLLQQTVQYFAAQV
ncbi:kinase [Fusarium albosuccineum]|uniref:Kinase n=1 Tax=Fusarium albosuccineum TaxID=1237068 RepID=A0A8H4LGR4_9HYPO|nr:kinase [Fusarium albosuccineum]